MKHKHLILLLLAGMYAICVLWMVFVCDTGLLSILGVFVLSALCVYLIVYISSLFHCNLDDDYICLSFGTIKYKKIEYEDILGIAVTGAVDNTYHPIVDKMNVPKAVVTAYTSEHSFPKSIHSYGAVMIPHSRILDKHLFYLFLERETFEKILLKTDAKVYVTENMMRMHSVILFDILSKHSKRVYVLCTKEQGGVENISYDEWIESKFCKVQPLIRLH